jgi:hypothetical protein
MNLNINITFGEFKAFYHNSKGAVLFTNVEEGENFNNEFKYSILNEINSKMKINFKFEFLLEYPSIQSKYNRWEQNLNLLYNLEVSC